MKTAILLTLLQLGTGGMDAYYTNRNLSSHQYRELNPFTRPFVQSEGGRIAYFSVTTGLKVALPWVLRHRHHERLATLSAVAGIADNAVEGVYSARH